MASNKTEKRFEGLKELEDRVSLIACYVIDELETIKLQAERIVGDLFEESVEGSPLAPSIPMAAPDTGKRKYSRALKDISPIS